MSGALTTSVANRNRSRVELNEVGQTDASNKTCKLHEMSHTSAPQPVCRAWSTGRFGDPFFWRKWRQDLNSATPCRQSS